MRITCPNCAAVYDVPDQMLAGTPRPVRCARCAQEWVPSATAALTAPAPAALQARRDVAFDDELDSGVAAVDAAPTNAPRFEPRLSVREPLVESPRDDPPRIVGGMAGVIGWLLTVAIVAAAAAVIVLRQPQIEALWPPSQRLYAMLKLH